MSAPAVLYDAPGPRARMRNSAYTGLFFAALMAAAYWVLSAMYSVGELDWAKWSPFLDLSTWATFLLPGLVNTLMAAAFAILIALPVGFVFGVARLSDHWWLRRPAGVAVELFRAIPVLVLMLFANEAYALFTDIDSEARPMYAVVTGLVLYNGSVLAEVVRAGILALPRGQNEAAVAVGMRKGQVMTNVLLPQSVTAMLPAIVSQLVVVVKDTALGGWVLGFSELLRQVQPITANHGNTIAAFVVVAAIFIAVNFTLTSFASWLEKWLRTRKRSPAQPSSRVLEHSR